MILRVLSPVRHASGFVGGLLLLAGCAATPTPAPPIIAPPPPPPPVQPVMGLEQVIGHAPADAIQLIGSPELDRQEGKGRHLQFVGGACVLDLFYYPQAGGGEPVATYAEARFRNGNPLDAASCLQLQVKAQPVTAQAPTPPPRPQPGPRRPRAARVPG